MGEKKMKKIAQTPSKRLTNTLRKT